MENVNSLYEKERYLRKKGKCFGDALSVIDVAVSSENGNVSIPKTIIEKLHIAPGAKFAVLVDGDTLIFKKIQAPAEKEFEKLVDKGTRSAERNKIEEEDRGDIIHNYRRVHIF
jgi:antitoxin component of MazEF toxin-antitoxin module